MRKSKFCRVYTAEYTGFSVSIIPKALALLLVAAEAALQGCRLPFQKGSNQFHRGALSSKVTLWKFKRQMLQRYNTCSPAYRDIPDIGQSGHDGLYAASVVNKAWIWELKSAVPKLKPSFKQTCLKEKDARSPQPPQPQLAVASWGSAAEICCSTRACLRLNDIWRWGAVGRWERL